MLLNRERERGCYTATKKDREEHFARLWQKKKVGETTMRHFFSSFLEREKESRLNDITRMIKIERAQLCVIQR
jgi:hypothetical protein